MERTDLNTRWAKRVRTRNESGPKKPPNYSFRRIFGGNTSAPRSVGFKSYSEPVAARCFFFLTRTASRFLTSLNRETPNNISHTEIEIMAVGGTQQNSNEWRKNLTAPAPKPSFVVGEVQTPLWEITLTQLLQQQVLSNPSGECVIFPEHNYRATYNQLYQTTLEVAQGLRAIGIGHGDRVGIFAGNIPAYVELFFASSHVGAAYVVFNTTYTPKELQFALQHSGRLPLETVRET
jgi:AMP-binding enzyme